MLKLSQEKDEEEEVKPLSMQILEKEIPGF